MKVFLIGTGCGAAALTAEARAAIDQAQLVIGARRLVDAYAPDGSSRAEAVLAEDIAALIAGAACERICVLFSGDSGFYSGARRLLPLLNGYDVQLLPGISSLQLFAARLGRPWQDWRLCSAHGVACDAVAEVCQGKPVFFLTGGKLGPSELCAQLCEAGLGALPVCTGEELGTDRERIRRGCAAEFAAEKFSVLSVMLAESVPETSRRSPGLPDALFQRTEKIPMTKQEVRAAALAKLGIRPEDICWDIGTGTGSVAIELALCARAVYGVERSPEALETAKINREKLGAWKLRLIEGTAPEALAGLPAPDAVFIGGSGGKLRQILKAVYAANPEARICVSAIALESLHNAYTSLEELGYNVEISQIAVSRSRAVAGLHMMTAQNPVYLVSGERQ